MGRGKIESTCFIIICPCFLFFRIQEFKRAISVGDSLERVVSKSNLDRDIPIDIVEARKYNQFADDGF